MEIIRRAEIESLANPGVTSRQMLSPANAPTAGVTITEVTVEPGGANPRHAHSGAEQVWIALRGIGVILVADGASTPFGEGDVARFAPGDVHGFHNTGTSDFVYLAVTSPPVDFRGAYRAHADGRR